MARIFSPLFRHFSIPRRLPKLYSCLAKFLHHTSECSLSPRFLPLLLIPLPGDLNSPYLSPELHTCLASLFLCSFLLHSLSPYKCLVFLILPPCTAYHLPPSLPVAQLVLRPRYLISPFPLCFHLQMHDSLISSTCRLFTSSTFISPFNTERKWAKRERVGGLCRLNTGAKRGKTYLKLWWIVVQQLVWSGSGFGKKSLHMSPPGEAPLELSTHRPFWGHQYKRVRVRTRSYDCLYFLMRSELQTFNFLFVDLPPSIKKEKAFVLAYLSLSFILWGRSRGLEEDKMRTEETSFLQSYSSSVTINNGL